MINKENKIFLEIIDDIKKSNEQIISYDEEFQLKKFAYIVNNKEEFEKLGYEIKIVDSVFGYDTVSLKKDLNKISTTPQGWVCPICHRVYSPMTSMCYYCGGEQKTMTYTTSAENIEIAKMNKHAPIHPQQQMRW